MHGHGHMEEHGSCCGGHGHGLGHHGHGRMRRGDVQSAVLTLLKDSEMHGYQMIQELSKRSNGAWTPSPGSIYPTLQVLEEQDLVTSEQVDGKRIYSLTHHGREVADSQPQEPWADIAEDPFTQQAIAERRARTAHAHGAHLIATVLGGLLLFGLFRSASRCCK